MNTSRRKSRRGSPSRPRLVSADAGGTIEVWNAQGQPTASLAGHAGGVNQLAFRPDGKRLATASLDGACKLWDPDNWKEVRSLTGDGKTFESVAWSRDGKLLAAGNDAEAVVWNADTCEVLHTLKTPAGGLLAFSPDGRLLACGDTHTIQVIDRQADRRLHTFRGLWHKTPQGPHVACPPLGALA